MGTSISIEGFSLTTPSTWVPVFGNYCGPGWSSGKRTDRDGLAHGRFRSPC